MMQIINEILDENSCLLRISLASVSSNLFSSNSTSFPQDGKYSLGILEAQIS